MKPLLLIACSANKHRYLKSGRADEIYVGTLLRAGIVWAEENDHDVWILSAKYGSGEILSLRHTIRNVRITMLSHGLKAKVSILEEVYTLGKHLIDLNH